MLQIGHNLNVHKLGWINNLRYIYTMEYSLNYEKEQTTNTHDIMTDS